MPTTSRRLTLRSALLAAIVTAAAGLAGTNATAGDAYYKDSRRPKQLASFDAESGNRQWKLESSGRPGRLLARGISNGNVIAEEVACSNRDAVESGTSVAVVGFDRTTGEEAWRVPGKNIRGQLNQGVSVGRSTVAWIEARLDGTSLLRTVDATDGAERWSLDIAGSGILAANDDVLVIETPDRPLPTSTVNVYDRERGTLRWTASIRRGAGGGTAAVGKSLVAVSSGDYRGGPITVYDSSGEARWSLDGLPSASNLYIVGNVLVMHFSNGATGGAFAPGFVLALALDTGVELWRGPSNAPFSVAAVEGTVFVGSGFGTTPELNGLDAETGEFRWRSDAASETYLVRPLVVETSDLVAIPLDDEIVVRDLETGKRRWRRDFPDGTASVAAGGGSLFVAGGCTPLDPH